MYIDNPGGIGGIAATETLSMRQKRPTGMMDLIRDRTMSPAVNNKKKFAGLIGMKLNGIVLVNSTQNTVTMDRRTIEHRQPMYYRWYLDGRLFFAAQYNHSLHSMLPDWTFFPSFLFSFFSPLFSSTSSLALALSLFFSFFLFLFFSLRVVFFPIHDIPCPFAILLAVVVDFLCRLTQRHTFRLRPLSLFLFSLFSLPSPSSLSLLLPLSLPPSSLSTSISPNWRQY